MIQGKSKADIRLASAGDLSSPAKHTVYAYFLGNDFGEIAEAFAEHASQFIQSRRWICPDIWSVNQQRIAKDGAPEWELGVNLSLPDPHLETPGWFVDVEEIVVFCVAARNEFQRDFVIGISDNVRRFSEDIIEITAEPPALEYLRDFIGIAPPDETRT